MLDLLKTTLTSSNACKDVKTFGNHYRDYNVLSVCFRRHVESSNWLHSVFILCTFFLGVEAKVGSSPFLKCATQFPLILWHPYARHYYFCVVTEKEQQKWHAVLQDCVRHINDGESHQLMMNINSCTHTCMWWWTKSTKPHDFNSLYD